MTAANAAAAADLVQTLSRLDRGAQAVMMYQIALCVSAKSKAWRTRRINDFRRWMETNRPNQAQIVRQMEIAG